MMPTRVLMPILLAITALLAGPFTAGAMSTYTWKKRPLVVIAPDEQSADLASQRAIVTAARGGFAERDMVVVYIVGENVKADLGASPGQSASALRARYGVARTAFRVLLVGKDGGVKLSSAAPLAAGTLFGEIDKMPMRVDEMRRRK